MRKLILTCDCGQRIQLPRAAVGKTGVCPTCGKAIHITKENTKPLTARERLRAQAFNTNSNAWKGAEAPNDDARRLFGRGADLYCEGRYAEALAIFDTLARRFPGIPEIENARTQCLAARSRPIYALPRPGEGSPLDGKADPETVKSVVLQKMLHGKSEETQLKAAELMARILGMLDGVNAGNGAVRANAEEAPEAKEPEAARGGFDGEEYGRGEEASPISFTEFTKDRSR